MGAHPKGPATANVAGIEIPLNRLIAEAPEKILGPTASAHFGGRLPYLFKVLDVAETLSIQAHPTKKQAEEGFARENAAGIDLRASERNYKGDSDKPEVAVALTEFWMLHGFRSLEQIAEIGGARCAPASQKKRRLRFSGFKQQHEVDSVLLRGAQARS
jgi:mannose-6-phosphate isomerase